MRLKFYSVILWLLSVLAFGQNSVKGSTVPQNSIHGIKIFSSNFDGRSVQLDFMNDSKANITAWSYCVKAQKANNSDPDQSLCAWVDALPVAMDRDIQERISLKPMIGDSTDGHFIHPGEHKTIAINFIWGPVTSAKIEMSLIVYADGTAESSGESGERALLQIAQDRGKRLRLTQMLAHAGQGILDDQNEQHPAARMITELQNLAQIEPALKSSLDLFKRPQWRKGDNTEFIPEDERGYLSKFVLELQLKAAELAKNQIQEVK